MKRILVFLLCFLCLPLAGRAQKTRIGICLYAGGDTFILSMLSELRLEAGGAADLEILSAGGDQNRQNDQIQQLIRSDIDILAVNPVDRTSAVYIIELAKTHDIPIILFNREPLREDLDTWEKAYYVGIDPRQQGKLQAKLALEYFDLHPEQDLNGDGIIQYVLLRGEAGHQDSELRSSASQKALNEEGFRAEKLAEESANWEKAQGQERMAMLINSLGKRIECVLSNNDDMALGAIDALKAAGYFGGGLTIPVIGVDATAAALDMMAQGALYGTVQNNAQAQAQAIIELALLLARGDAVTASSFSYPLDNKVVYIESTMIKKDD
ncbi:MAG: substrate-binding domain-containing protein [Clostridiales bacterium]|nr:substrate-binding domain-containing protein [Clostridiales bacterium]